MATRCTKCGAWQASSADHMPAPDMMLRLYPHLGILSDLAAEWDRNSLRSKSGEPELTTAAEFTAWCDFEIRTAAGVTHGRLYGTGNARELLEAAR